MNSPTSAALFVASLTAGLSVLSLGGAVAHADDAARKPLAVFRDGMWVRAPGTCGTPQTPPANYEPARVDSTNRAGSLQTVYLNKAGGTYVIGSAGTNAKNNTVRASDWNFGSRTVNLTAPTLAGEDWTVITACVREHFKRWNILVTDQEPATGDFIEATFGGNDGSEIGFPSSQGQLFGIAANDTFCSLYKTGIAFIFEKTHQQAFPAGANRNAEVCNTMVHEVGHVLGLEHLEGGHEHMSYVYIKTPSPTAGGACLTDPLGLACKDFVDAPSGCGTIPADGTMSCNCVSGTSSSSGMRLQTLIGIRPVETTPPSLTLTGPDDVKHLPPTFDVTAKASDETQMQDVAVYLDGAEVGRDALPDDDEYVVRVENVAEGAHELRVVATDAAGNTTEKAESIQVVKLATGESCLDSESCHGGICAQDGEDSFCTEACVVDSNTCPDDFECQAVGGTSICVATDGGGCCSASSNGPMGAAGMLVLGVGLVLSRRRRRA